MDICVIGIDPGQVTGIARLRLSTRPPRHLMRVVSAEVCQTTPGLVIPVLDGLRLRIEDSARIVIAVERFVVGPRASKSANAKAGTVTRELVTLIDAWAQVTGSGLSERSAAEVKPWATDARLTQARLFDLCVGMRHARDAARHALYEAVKAHGLLDPLSPRAGAQ